MPKDTRKPGKQKRGIINLILTAVVLFILFGIPFMFISYQGKQKGMTRSEVLKRLMNKSG
jgi:hypothetical protein